MKANELRIGNWVKTCVPDMEIMMPCLDTQVQGIDIFGRPIFCHTPQREGFSMSPNHIAGIPLTPEILEKAGFVRYNGAWSDLYVGELCDGQKTWLTTEGKIFGLLSKNEGAMKPSDIAAIYNGIKKDDFIPNVEEHYLWLREDLKYLHQLQNLYFALTATELEINLNKEK